MGRACRCCLARRLGAVLIPKIKWPLMTLGPVPIIIMIGLVIMSTMASCWTFTSRLLDDNQWVSHTYVVQQKLYTFLADATEAESGERGYVLIGDPPYLDDYHAAAAKMLPDVGVIAALTTDSPVQVKHCAELKTLVQQKLDWMSRAESVYAKGGEKAASEMGRTHQGKRIMDAIRIKVGEMQAEEARLLILRSSTQRTSIRARVSILNTNMIFLTLLFAAASVFYYRGYIEESAPQSGDAPPVEPEALPSLDVLEDKIP
jgi:CHASE3 domain sensor protein